MIEKQGTFTDPRDGTTYKTVKIGNQVWFAENLNYAGYDNEDGSKCYDNNPENGLKYGRLYNWATAMKACPPGWHLPTEKEWNELIKFAGGKKEAGKRLKAANGWSDWLERSGCGTDDYGFAALPGGIGMLPHGSYYKELSFEHIGEWSSWWCSSEYAPSIAYYFSMHNVDDNEVIRQQYAKLYPLYSVRCVQGEPQEMNTECEHEFEFAAWAENAPAVLCCKKCNLMESEELVTKDIARKIYDLREAQKTLNSIEKSETAKLHEITYNVDGVCGFKTIASSETDWKAVAEALFLQYKVNDSEAKKLIDANTKKLSYETLIFEMSMLDIDIAKERIIKAIYSAKEDAKNVKIHYGG